MTRAELVKLLKQLRELVEDDALALEGKELYPFWNDTKSYEVGAKVQYGDNLYKCLQAHTSLPTWTPTDAPSLWAKVLIPDPDVIPEWEQPDSTNPYMQGDKVMYNGKVYVSLIDNNVWSPADFPQGWQEVQ